MLQNIIPKGHRGCTTLSSSSQKVTFLFFPTFRKSFGRIFRKSLHHCTTTFKRKRFSKIMIDNHKYLRVQIVVQRWCRWVQMGCRKEGRFLSAPSFFLLMVWTYRRGADGAVKKIGIKHVFQHGIRILSPSSFVLQYGKKNLLLVFRFIFRLVRKTELACFWVRFCARFRLGKVSRGLQNRRKKAELSDGFRQFLLPKVGQSVRIFNRINRLSAYQVSGDRGFGTIPPSKNRRVSRPAPPLLLFINWGDIRRDFQRSQYADSLRFQVFATLKEGGEGGDA